MILVDTSVWIAAFRGQDPESEKLKGLLDSDSVALAAPVRIEILSGARTNDLARLKRTLSALPRFTPSPTCWERIEVWVEEATRAGQRFALGDLIIASVAAEFDLPLWSLDADFKRMEVLGFVQLHTP